MNRNIDGLKKLNADIQRDLEFINYPAENWVKPAPAPGGEDALDVVIIGGGASGMAVAFGLMRAGIRNFRTFDQAKEGKEGPWVTTARMRNLRSPKHLTGPHMGLPNLTFQAWYRARFGAQQWEALNRIPREIWMDYLVWYRQVLQLPIENETALIQIIPKGNLFQLKLERQGQALSLYCKRVVLATGRAAYGGTRRPEIFSSLARSSYGHSEEAIDFAALAGKDVAVIGGGASAIDNAAAALEAGAARVDMLIRAKEMPRVNKFKSIVYPGYMHGYIDLDMETRWRFLHAGLSARVAPPRDSMLRVKEYVNFRLHLDCRIEKAQGRRGRVELESSQGNRVADFVILGTGYAIDIRQQGELAAFAEDIQLWRDCFTPQGDIADAELGRYPYLGPDFEFLPKKDGDAPYLARLHLFNAAATLSHGPISSDIPGTNIGAERLVSALIRHFFVENADQHLADFHAYDEPELLGDEWNET